MERPIQVGDLVVVVKPSPCCNDAGALGYIYRVARISTEESFCDVCHRTSNATIAWESLKDNALGHRLPELKRIKGLGELIEVTTKKHKPEFVK